MRIRIITAGGYNSDFIRDGVDYYLKKVNYFLKTEIIVPKSKINYSSSKEKIKKEAMLIEDCIKDDDYVILCDVNGNGFDSTELAKKFENVMNAGKDISFVIGGDEGVDERLKKRADILFSFSKQTFNHELAVLILMESIYRSFTIIKKYPYHK